MNKLQIRNSILLLITALIWGCSFVAQSVGMDYIGPFTFSALRSILGFLFLLPCIWIREIQKDNTPLQVERKKNKSDLIKSGISCGVLLFLGMNLQQMGIVYTSVGKSGFLTALYIILVPVIGLFMGKKSSKKLWAAIALAVAGLYLLCMKVGSFEFEIGDVLLLLGAVAFAMHILIIHHFTDRVGGIKMSCVQFLVAGILSAICMFLFEDISMGAVFMAWKPVAYSGIFSCGVAYTLQIVGQRGINPVVASLILSLEAVISAIAGWAILGEKLSQRELLGCAVMFGAIILAQLPTKVVGDTEEVCQTV